MSNPRRPLYEYSGDELLGFLSRAQAGVRREEKEHALAKAKFDATAAVLAEARRHWDDKPLAGNVPHLIKEQPEYQVAHSKYLSALIDYMEAKDECRRASDSLNLWQTERADVRKI